MLRESKQALKFKVSLGNGQTYIKGSRKPITVKFDKDDIPELDDVNVYEMCTGNGGTVALPDPNGNQKTLSSGDYSTSEGSLNVTLSADLLEGLKIGNYSLTVTFVVAAGYPKASAPASFAVAAPTPAGINSPSIGESGTASAIAVALMMLAAYGVIYALSRRRNILGRAE